MSIVIHSDFDGGSIGCIDINQKGVIQVNIKKDNNAKYMQWFYFSISGIRNQHCKVKFLNASQCSYPLGWEGYSICASFDNRNWFRLPTSYDNSILETEFFFKQNTIHLAYFPPYDMEMQNKLTTKIVKSVQGCLFSSGKSPNGNPIEIFKLGIDNPGKKIIWIIARQHPGETMGTHFAEGVLDILIEESNFLSSILLSQYVFYVVPNINPDGSVNGNLRTNALGQNLNREWNKKSGASAVEVDFVRDKIHKTGVDLFLDIHGDEVLPYIFFVGSEGIHNSTKKMLDLNKIFTEKMLQHSKDFQNEFGYPKVKPGTGDLSIAKNYIASTFQCLSMTIELPFKDNANNECDKYGWSIPRCKKFAKEVLETIHSLVEKL